MGWAGLIDFQDGDLGEECGVVSTIKFEYQGFYFLLFFIHLK